MISFDVFILALITLYVFGVAIKRLCRAIMVSRAGWPPPHLDCDGDPVAWKTTCNCDCEEEAEVIDHKPERAA